MTEEGKTQRLFSRVRGLPLHSLVVGWSLLASRIPFKAQLPSWVQLFLFFAMAVNMVSYRNQRDKKEALLKSSMERNATEGRNIPVMGVQQETSGL
ncbi:hypothetical protein TNCV_4107221 [Trichonephila clavipes]|nr:hypothetical protein TNCV_4107221 [Trichonephila clavipes]